jgi:hypothetical protein
MAKVKSSGYTDTAISGNPVLNLLRGSLNFAANWRQKSYTPGKEVILTNISSPNDRPERLRIAFSDVANVYSGTGIDASVFAPTKKGVSILAQLTEIIAVTDDTDPSYRIDLPVSYHLVIKVPSSEFINAVDVQTGVARLLSGLYDTGSVTTTRLDAILRGSLVPSDV